MCLIAWQKDLNSFLNALDMENLTRREFLELTAKGTAATVTGISAIDKLLSPEQAQAAPVSNGASNAKNAGSVISLPKGGGAIKGIGETFKPNPFTGTANFSVPIATSLGRAGLGPELSLQYSSGNGNGAFGLGWALSVPMVSRKTEKGIPKYIDDDVFVLSGAEDLVPRTDDEAPWKPENVGNYRVVTYRPRTEGLFAKIERWQRISGTADKALNDMFWKITTKDNITSIYGLTKAASLRNRNINRDPAQGVFQWYLELTYDDKGNCIRYGYKNDTADDLPSRPSEAHRSKDETYQNYLKSIRYGNLDPFFATDIDDIIAHLKAEPEPGSNFFLVLFDYGEHGAKEKCIDCEGELYDHVITTNTHEEEDENLQTWDIRPDPFSNYRAGFEIRTYRRCQRVLMFHYMPGDTTPALVRSTDFQYDQLPYSQYSTLINVTQRGYRKLETPRPVNDPVESEEIALRKPNQKLSGAKSRYYWIKSVPPLELKYSRFEPHKQKFKPFASESGDMPPSSLKDPNFTLVDITKTGLPDVLQTTPFGYYYWQNLGNGKFDLRRELKNRPAGITIGQAGVGFGDMAGDGTADLLAHTGSQWGFYESDSNGGWKRQHFYDSFPSFSLDDPNIRLTDLTGDGKSDILRTDERSFTWFPCLGEDGFDEPHYIRRRHDLEEFPDVYFNDPRVQLADMTGDGLNDMVLVHSGRIDYWPNLGYGKFGKRVTMENTPRFGYDFDPARLFLVDIDGSGPVDMVYVEAGKVRFWFNRSGNSWSEEQVINGTPYITDADSLQFADMFGSGSNGILWSTDFRANGHSNYMYLDFSGGIKPNVLVEINNNMGTTTRAQYKPSTHFYLQDRQTNPYDPWLTTLPFPVQCLEKVEVIDHVSKSKLITRYKYHHGYYDGKEREFRGFAFVEQWDTEFFDDFTASDSDNDEVLLNVEQSFYVPPVYTKTWFLTGAFPADIEDDLRKNARNRRLKSIELRNVFARDYYAGDPKAPSLPPSSIIESNSFIDVQSMREAYRALRGQVIRQEVFAADDSLQKSMHPYTVTESNAAVKFLQGRGQNKHAVLFVHPRETLSFHYERALYNVDGRMVADPRTTHNITLDVDDYGNVLESISVAYGRRYADDSLAPQDAERQQRTILTYTKSLPTNTVTERYAYRTQLLWDTRTYELVNAPPPDAQRDRAGTYSFAQLQAVIAALADGNHDLLYDDFAGAGAVGQHPHRRLLEHERVQFRSNELDGPLAFGILESMALPWNTYKLAFTPDLITAKFGTRVTQDMLADEGGYVQLPNHNGWWIPSGSTRFSLDKNDTPQQELTFAQQHFFLPHCFIDPFDNASTVEYDDPRLLPKISTDPVGNRIVAENDYRVLQPKLVTDPNGNRSEVSFDALGMVVGTAVMGKTGENKGDSLQGFEPDLGVLELLDHLRNPLQNPHQLLQSASTRLIYDPFSFMRARLTDNPQPALALTIARETHAADLGSDERSELQHSISYSDGFGREIQRKTQVEPGPLVEGGPDVDPRWVCSGWIVFNNKGKPVRQFEPFFTDTHRFEFNVRRGVSPILHYDPAERVVATLHPNKTWEKVVFDPWKQVTWDVNDTVLITPESDADVGDFFERLPNGEYLPTWHTLRTDPVLSENEWDDPAIRRAEAEAASKAGAHANTPTTTFLDPLGRTFLTAAHNGLDANGNAIIYNTRLILDIEGNQREVIDAKERVVMSYDYDMLGNRIHQNSMDAGERWMLNDVTGNPIYAWDSRNHQFQTAYDALRRPTESFLRKGGDARITIGRTIYGESQGDHCNLRGRVWKVQDQAGEVTHVCYDFKGNLKRTQRQLARVFKSTLDWSSPPALEPEIFSSRVCYDALNRPIQSIAPHSDRLDTKINIVQPRYNKANLLKGVDAWLEQNAEPPAMLDPTTATMRAVINIDYDAKGQRQQIEYGNGVKTTYKYDKETFRLIHLLSKRDANSFPNDCPEPRPTGWSGCQIQSLHYTYDPAGNITHIRDDAQQTIFFRNKRVEPSNDYTYDAIYRLIEATGREHLGQAGQKPTAPDAFNHYHIRKLHPGDGNAMGRYTETYSYDEVGNILSMRHRGADPAHSGWKRCYQYAVDSNRLLSTSAPNDPHDPDDPCATHYAATPYYAERYQYDAHGNMTRMPHLPLMQWDHKDQLQATAQQVVNNGTPETTYYVYDATGQRVRKVTERATNSPQATPTRMKERIYLGGFEIYREYDSDGETVSLERETAHIMDDKQRIALVETRTHGTDAGLPQLTRYQIGNHLSSVCIELDDQAQIISYEEYFPYGSTSYQGVRSQTETPKRYRYSGKERDDSTGLYYYGARYYAPWMGRWISCDPLGLTDGINLYKFIQNNPIKYEDKSGKQTDPNTTTPILKPDDVAIYKETKGVTRQGQNLQGDHIIAQKKLKMMENPNYKPGNDPVVMQETGKATGDAPAKPHTQKTFIDPQADVKEISRLKQGGYKHFTTDIVEPSRNAALRSGYKPEAVDEALWGQINEMLGWDGSMPEVGEKLGVTPDDVEEALKDFDPSMERSTKAGAEKVAKESVGEVVEDVGGKVVKKGTEEGLEKGGKELLEKGGKELLKKGAKRFAKFVLGIWPGLGMVGEVMLAEEGATNAEIALRAVGGEVGAGPMDATTAFDLTTAYWDYASAEILEPMHKFIEMQTNPRLNF